MDELTPSEFYLSQNYPNPFKEKTIIKYCVAYKTWVSLTIFNDEGEMIERLVNEEKDAGTYEVEFNVLKLNAKKQALSDGNYLYDFKAGDCFKSKKMTLNKQR